MSANLPLSLEPPKCVGEADSWCTQVFELTGSAWLAASADWLIAKPLTILLILVVAVIVRLLARKAIDRLTNGDGKTPKLLRPLKERAPQALGSILSERRAQRAKTIGSVLKSIVTAVVFGLAFMLVLGELGVNLAPIIASAGIVGVALGFGAQNLVRDFLSGIFMLLEDQYGVGDIVDLGEATGTIEGVGLRVTTLRDLNGTVWYVRNGEILRVGNFSQGFAVAVVDLPVGYSADAEQVTSILRRVSGELTEDSDHATDVIEPPEVLGVEKVTPEGMTFRVTVKVRPGRQWAVQRALRARAMAALEEADIQPPLGRLFPPAPQP
ncbi:MULTISPECIES: mechanosensitive ion channel family protein [Actinokineospora]|uniref:Mechanosensitive ion channel protein MscS n=1 Tax=Actinokineospora fastidiosa TaxID=1816 RepID=A0A918GK99_9PSEU|nr:MULTISPECIES: mechanosensitive ion channel family protein [Actinokineospora]UVS77599.1 putative MscS family protein YkuT [Actinokineospora sp. UTMC 2448]GGS42287.1 mechanosensitive ion channel protein MscS [Actinokineospora fastidiosa]